MTDPPDVTHRQVTEGAGPRAWCQSILGFPPLLSQQAKETWVVSLES